MLKKYFPSQSVSLKNWALYYASLNWPIIPLHNPLDDGHCSCGRVRCKSIAKHPRTKNGLKDATTDETTINSWWEKWPNANIGILTGKQSRFFVVDVDPRHGGDQSILEWKKHLEFLNASKVITGGGGEHYYFSYPKTADNGIELDIRNKVNVLPGIDIRGNGGHIVAPPSKHASGGSYSWQDNDLRLSPTTSWLIDQITHPIKKRETDTTIIKQSLKLIPEGARNSFLASVAGSLRKYGLEQESIEKQLEALNQQVCSPALSHEEISQIAKSISKYPTHIEDPKDWEKPMAIPQINFVVPKMNDSYLPEILHEWVADIAHRMQVPLEFIATPAIVALSAVIGRKVGIYPKQNDDWLVIPNLWGAIIARPGYFKSPAMAEAFRPLEKLVNNENGVFEKLKKAHEIDKSIHEATVTAVKDQLIKAIKKGNGKEIDHLRSRLSEIVNEIEEKEPKAKRYKTNDTTIEKLSNLLLENPNGLMLIRDELAGWLSSLQKFGREGDREFYLEAWNGYGSYTIDRIGRGTLHIPALCLSIFGGIQPSKLKKYLSDRLDKNDDGLLQRLQILIYPEMDQKWENVDKHPDFDAQNKVNKLFHTLDGLYFESNDEGLKGLHFDESAQAVFNEWRCELETTLRSGKINHPSYESHLAKYRSLVPSLALVFYLIERDSTKLNLNEKEHVNERSIRLAIKWCEFLDKNAQKIYEVNAIQDYHSIMALVSKIKEGKIHDDDNIRDLYRHNWQYLNAPEKIESSLNYLSNLHWLKIEETQSPYRKGKIIKMSPRLKEVI